MISQPGIIYVKVMLMKISRGTEEVWGRARMQKGHRSVKSQRKPTDTGCQT